MSIPTKEEFFAPLPVPDDDSFSPDMKEAWSQFGGKSMDEAYEHFCDAPNSRPEDFMFMPEGGFRYYFPVLDRYLRNLSPMLEDSSFDYPRAGWFIAHAIKMHFGCQEDMSGLHEPILALCDYVCAHLSHLDFEPVGQEEIRAAWADLRQKVADDTHGLHPPRK